MKLNSKLLVNKSTILYKWIMGIILVMTGIMIGFLISCVLIKNPPLFESNGAHIKDDESDIPLVLDGDNSRPELTQNSCIYLEKVEEEINNSQLKPQSVGGAESKESFDLYFKTNDSNGNEENNNIEKIKLYTKTDCNIRSGPGTKFPSIKVVSAKSEVYVTDCFSNENKQKWYKVELKDGTEGYISGSCICEDNVENNSDSTAINRCSFDEAKEEKAIPQKDESTTNNATEQQMFAEVSNEKYDYRPGDYHGELMQFMERPISDVQAAFPSFTNEWYGDHGDFYDNNWMTVNFCYKDVVNEIWLDAADPTYSLMGISIGMDPETARLILADHGYPFEYLPDNARYWMHSPDDHYEVEIATIDGKVSSMMYLDLTSVDSWWKSNGIIY